MTRQTLRRPLLTAAPRFITAAASVLLLTGGLASPALAQNLLANGGFETGTVYGRPNGTGSVPHPWRTPFATNGQVNGPYDTWSMVLNTGLNPASNTSLFPLPIAPAEGVRWVGGERRGVLSQPLNSPLVPGSVYNISALIHSTQSGLGFGGLEFVLFEVVHGGPSHAVPVVVATTPPVFYSQGWVLWSSSFVAPAGALRLQEFGLRGNMGLDTQYMCVDDVRLTALPAPGTTALLALAGLVATRRRRPGRGNPLAN